MAENVNTGGLMSFRYNKNAPRASQEEKDDIEEAYARADERKKREKMNKIISWIIAILILIILGVSAYFYFR